MVNFYTLLGIDCNATHDQINAAFKEAAKKYHPDKNEGNEASHQMFLLIQKAKETLLNPIERLTHDYATGIKVKPMQPPIKSDNTVAWAGGLFLGALLTLGAVALFSDNSNSNKQRQ